MLEQLSVSSLFIKILSSQFASLLNLSASVIAGLVKFCLLWDVTLQKMAFYNFISLLLWRRMKLLMKRRPGRYIDRIMWTSMGEQFSSWDLVARFNVYLRNLLSLSLWMCVFVCFHVWWLFIIKLFLNILKKFDLCRNILMTCSYPILRILSKSCAEGFRSSSSWVYVFFFFHLLLWSLWIRQANYHKFLIWWITVWIVVFPFLSTHCILIFMWKINIRPIFGSTTNAFMLCIESKILEKIA